MKRNDYKAFKEIVEKATATDPVWWAGYLWISLTDNQGKEIIEIMKNNACCTVIPDGVRTPTGFELTFRKGV